MTNVLNLQSFPLQKWPAPSNLLDGIDTFIQWQMNQFGTFGGARYIQTFAMPEPTNWQAKGNIAFRGDTYDTSVASIYMTERGHLEDARDLLNGIYTAMQHDPVGDGRIVAASWTNSLTTENASADVKFPVSTMDGSYYVGNMAWAAQAFLRYYVATDHQHSKFLNAARLIGHWIDTNCHYTADSWGGFSGGFDSSGSKLTWRSVEHNTDCFALFRNLHNVTGDEKWHTLATIAQNFVKHCFHNNSYVTGTNPNAQQLNVVYPADCQTWTTLAGIDTANNDAALNYLVNNLWTTADTFAGVKFTNQGTGVQNEQVAGAVMALNLQGGSFTAKATMLLNSLKSQRTKAQNANNHGITATPNNEAKTGLGWSYFPYPHVAASAWTGLAMLAQTNPQANPFAEISN